MASDEAEELAKKFMASYKDILKDIDSSDRFMLTLNVANYLTTRKIGDKTETKNHLKEFIGNCRATIGLTAENLPKLVKGLQAYGKKHARFTYKAAFAKRKSEIKKIISIGRKKGPKEKTKAISQLHTSMRRDQEISSTIPLAEFADEFDQMFAENVPDAVKVELTGKELEKELLRLNWANLLGMFGLKSGHKKDLVALAMIVKDSGRSMNSKGKKEAERILKLAKGSGNKSTPAQVYTAVHTHLKDAKLA